MYKITKKFMFSASHQLHGLKENHPCSRVHGHNYVITLELASEQLNSIGFVVDYRELDKFKLYVDMVCDHRHLNQVFKFNPTAENMAKYFYEVTKNMGLPVSAVEVSETDKTNARYEPTVN